MENFSDRLFSSFPTAPKDKSHVPLKGFFLHLHIADLFTFSMPGDFNDIVLGYSKKKNSHPSANAWQTKKVLIKIEILDWTSIQVLNNSESQDQV